MFYKKAIKIANWSVGKRHQSYHFQGLYFGASISESTQVWPEMYLFQYGFVSCCFSFRPTRRKINQMTSYRPKLKGLIAHNAFLDQD